MPQLGLLLEGHPSPQVSRHRRSPESAAVSAAFGGRPTQRQIEALNVALNTPDIALIQGPPGTGKTKVITALQRRIAELADEGRASVAHRILVTSAQHDAVENVVQRSEVFGLPAVKVVAAAATTEPESTAWRSSAPIAPSVSAPACPIPRQAERVARARTIAVLPPRADAGQRDRRDRASPATWLRD